jgi:hypothetical protein
MKIGLPQGKKAIRLLYGFGGAMLLIAGGSGVVLGEERADPGAVFSSTLYEAVVAGDDAGAAEAQQLLDVERERIAKQEGLTEAERRVRLTALEDTTAIYISMIGRLREIKMRNPDLGSVEAKTLLKSASAVVDRLEERGQTPVPVSARDLLSEGMKGLALLGLFSLLAGVSLTFPIRQAILKPFRALVALLTTARVA